MILSSAGDGQSLSSLVRRPCRQCDGAGRQRASIYYPHWGYSEFRFCTCPLGRSQLKAWKRAPQQRRHAQRARKSAITRELSLSQIPSRFAACRLRDLEGQPDLYQACMDYLRKWPKHRRVGTGLFLFGRVGAGKSTAAAALASSIVRKHLAPTYFVSLPELAVQFLGADGSQQDLWRSMRSAELLVLEDLDRVEQVQELQGLLYGVVDHRWRCKLPMILTAACSLERLSHLYGDALISRLRGACFQIEVPGRDQRCPPLPRG